MQYERQAIDADAPTQYTAIIISGPAIACRPLAVGYLFIWTGALIEPSIRN